MGDENDGVDDEFAATICSGSTYERVRLRRRTYVSQSTITKLGWQSLLLGGLALLLPIYLSFPATATPFIGSPDPAVASPKVLVLGLAGATVVSITAVTLVGATLYRVRNYPLDPAQARTVVDVEEVASALAFGTGGLTIGLTLGYFLLGLSGGPAIERYVSAMDGGNPFAASGLGLSVAEFAVGALLAAVCLLAIRRYLAGRVAELVDE
ncbi:hypothetical protein [Halorientalis halophila]|uniref:hypothetical protein n=1 Tax=Halorientalis halophila TaxID=3108499 RepID=UPI00300B1425